MSSDVKVRAHQQNAEELRLIQERHRKRRNQIVESNAKQINAIEDHHREKKSRLQNNHRAAISHIRESSKDQLEAITRQGEKKVRETREGYADRVADTDRQGQRKVSGLRSRYEEQQEVFRQRIQNDTNRAKRQQNFIGQQTKAFAKEQESKKQQIYNTSQEHMEQLREKNRVAAEKAKEAGQAHVRDIEETYGDKACLLYTSPSPRDPE